MRAAALLLAALPVAVQAQEPSEIGWSDLRPSGDAACAAAHAMSVSLKICDGVPSDITYHRCASETVGPGDDPIEIVGYAHPIEIEFRGVKRFLLMPALVDCRHPPAPMANQIILVDFPPGIDMTFDPIRVIGRLQAGLTLVDLTQVRYRLAATAIHPATHPEVRD